jgi:NitT/TauT family transport system substrate-binding protein
MIKPSTFLIWVAIATLALTGGTGCKKEAEKPEIPDLTYRLKWLFNTSVAGELYAMEHGVFKAAGLAVEIKPGGPEKDAIKELELGRAQFGVASADMVIRALSRGAPVVVVAQLFQVNPLQWVFRPARTTIETPADLKGKVLGVTFGGNDEAIMRALLAKHGIPEEAVELFSVRYDYTPFYQGEVDLWPVYRNAQGILIEEKLREAGEKAAFFDPDGAGVQFVANSVVTNREMIDAQPEVVARFVSALLTAWETAMDPGNSGETIRIIKRYDPDTPLAQIRQQWAITRKFVKPAPDFPIGAFDVPAWQETERIMVKQGLVPGPVNVTEVLAERFVDAPAARE